MSRWTLLRSCSQLSIMSDILLFFPYSWPKISDTSGFHLSLPLFSWCHFYFPHQLSTKSNVLSHSYLSDFSPISLTTPFIRFNFFCPNHKSVLVLSCLSSYHKTITHLLWLILLSWFLLCSITWNFSNVYCQLGLSFCDSHLYIQFLKGLSPDSLRQSETSHKKLNYSFLVPD